jgi:hypothetical protein
MVQPVIAGSGHAGGKHSALPTVSVPIEGVEPLLITAPSYPLRTDQEISLAQVPVAVQVS